MEKIGIGDITVYRFESEYLGTNMYVLFSDGESLVVDPHPDEEAATLLKEKAAIRTTVFLTHEHPDHTYGLPWLKKITDFQLICHRKCAETIAVERNNRPMLMMFVLEQKDEENGTHMMEKFTKEFIPFTLVADTIFEDVFSYDWHSEHFVFHYTPGHSQGSCCIIWNDRVIFTGDSLLKNMPVITRFPGGNTKQYNAVTKPFLDSLSDDITVLPGHGKIFTMKDLQEKTA